MWEIIEEDINIHYPMKLVPPKDLGSTLNRIFSVLIISSVVTTVTLFRSIAVFCGTNNILHNIVSPIKHCYESE